MGLVTGYPVSAGGKRISVITKAGPSSYTAVTPASPPTGGQAITAAEFGLKYIESLKASCSDDGTYEVKCIPKTAEVRSTEWILMWCLAVSGQETSGDLSARTVRLEAIGLQ